MDPNATLAELYRWASAVVNGQSVPIEECRAAELFMALDEWLRRDGYLPAPWGQRGGQ